jgi:hypothetical protein
MVDKGIIPICVPVGGKTSWQELRYMLRSLETNLTVQFECVFIVNEHIDWLRGEQVIITRGTSEPFETFRDTLKKYFAYATTHSGEFIIMYDDIVLLKLTNNFDMLKNVALDRMNKWAIKEAEDSKHGQTILRALSLLPHNKRWNYESHLPRVMDCELLVDIYNKFNVMGQNIPPALSTLYYNYYFERPNLVLAIENTLRASFCFDDYDGTGSYLFSKESDLVKCSEGKMFLHYNDRAISYHRNGDYILRNYIMRLFPNKSQYEKD